MNNRIQTLQEKLDNINKHNLLCLPTPMHKLAKLSAHLDADIWIKRDDLTGMALGGNKGRKLEYLMADAVAHGADCITACGACQSNHVRQTASASAMLGLECHLVLLGEEGDINGNILLNRWLGANMRFVGGDLWRDRDVQMWDYLDAELKKTTKSLIEEGRKPYEIPLGGSTAIGALGFVRAICELMTQTDKPFDKIIFASSSGGTQTGLTLGCKYAELPTQVYGISVDPEDVREDLLPVANKLSELLGAPQQFTFDDFIMNRNYVGDGYAAPTPVAIEAIRLTARLEGIFLDPVYTGKAMSGLIDLIDSNEIGSNERILFWHTGGTPALFAEDYENLIK